MVGKAKPIYSGLAPWTATDIAKAFDVSMSYVSQLVRMGTLVRGKDGLFDPVDSVQRQGGDGGTEARAGTW